MSEQPQTKQVSLYCSDWCPVGSTLPVVLPDLICFLQERMSKVPESCAGSCQLTLHSESPITVSIAYDRPETDKEQKERLKRDTQMANSQRAAEIATLHRLKAKYPNE